MTRDSKQNRRRYQVINKVFLFVTLPKKLLGFKAQTTFEEGVKQLLEKIEDFRDAPLWEPKSIEEATKTW